MILVDASYIQRDTLYKSLTIYIYRFLDSIPNQDVPKYKILIREEVYKHMCKKYPYFGIVSYNPDSGTELCNRLLKYIKRCRNYQKAVKRSECKILFVPNDLLTFSASKTMLKKIVVIHDMKSINEKKWYSFSFWIFWVYYLLLAIYAAKIIAVSNYTKKDILKYYHPFILKEKIKVVYNSVNICDNAKKYSLPSFFSDMRYILYVNALLPYKNVLTLVKAFVLINKRIKSNLVIVGRNSDYWRDEVLPYIREKGIEDRVIRLENIADEELTALYMNADLFVTTSQKEGFGYTPIEAAICKCPVISTRCEALADTTMGLLHYYNKPTDAVELSNAILDIYRHPQSDTELTMISDILKERYSPSVQYNQIKGIINEL